MYSLNRNRPLLIVLSLLLLISMFAFTGCGKSSGRLPEADGSGGDSPASPSPAVDITGTASSAAGPVYYTLPDKIKQVISLCVGSDGVIYLAAYLEAPKNPNAPADEQADVYTRPFKINADGSGLNELEGYIAPAAEGNKNEKMYLSAMSADTEGNIWVVEFNGAAVGDDPLILLRKLDSGGSELLKTDITGLFKNSGSYIYVFDIIADTAGNIYLADYYSGLYAFDSQGAQLFALPYTEGNTYMSGLARTGSGDIGSLVFENNSFVFKVLDSKSRGWSSKYPLDVAFDVFNGTGEYDFLYSDNTGLYGYSTDKNESTKCFSLSDYTKGMSLKALAPLDEASVVCALDSGYGYVTELAVLPLTPPPVDGSKTVLKLAGFGMGAYINDAVSAFNSANSEYRIEICDYQQYNTESEPAGGFKKLDMDILSDNMPDILCLNPRVAQSKYSSKGLLEDLYPYIDADAVLGGREAILPDVLRICETGTALYQLPPGFWLYTAAGIKDRLDGIKSATFDGLDSLMAKNPGITRAFSGSTKQDMLRYLLFNLDRYVDWEKGKCDFKSESFIRLLEFAGSYPDTLPDNEAQDPSLMLTAGKALLMTVALNSFYTVEYYESVLGSEMVFAGFPSDSGGVSLMFLVNSLSISSKSKYKDAAWEFIHSLLTEAMQTKDSLISFPVTKAAFEALAKEAARRQMTTGENGEEVEVAKGVAGSGDKQIPMYAVKESYVDMIRELMGSINSSMQMDQIILDIVSEEAQPYFAGQVSAEKAAEIIQSRVQLYISELQ